MWRGGDFEAAGIMPAEVWAKHVGLDSLSDGDCSIGSADLPRFLSARGEEAIRLKQSARFKSRPWVVEAARGPT